MAKNVCRVGMNPAPLHAATVVHSLRLVRMLREIPARHFSALLLMLALSAECHAVSFLSFDANVMGLGGAGAVTGIGGDRPYLNPAVIADGESLAALRPMSARA